MKHSDLTKKDVAKEGKMPQAAIDALAKKNGKSTKKDSKKDVQTEDLALMAHKAEMDHEVQMARSDLYKAAKYSIKLHELLKCFRRTRFRRLGSGKNYQSGRLFEFCKTLHGIRNDV